MVAEHGRRSTRLRLLGGVIVGHVAERLLLLLDGTELKLHRLGLPGLLVLEQREANEEVHDLVAQRQRGLPLRLESVNVSDHRHERGTLLVGGEGREPAQDGADRSISEQIAERQVAVLAVHGDRLHVLHEVGEAVPRLRALEVAAAEQLKQVGLDLQQLLVAVRGCGAAQLAEKQLLEQQLLHLLEVCNGGLVSLLEHVDPEKAGCARVEDTLWQHHTPGGAQRLHKAIVVVREVEDEAESTSQQADDHAR
mmetsp:Transcript_44653/g.123862  ORF Transcript_44653/g.123862 Transcript_44653/m.123862 type:complete len:252 (+) Transcript_44653:303-1058(+)|eukprot:7375476-Prymnesium_polylepis.1